MARVIQLVDTDVIDSAIQRLYSRAGMIAILGNVALLAAKGWVALISGSSAIYADAANSASDVVYSLLAVVGLWLALRPPDADHPHGHRRIEPLVSLVIGAMMTLAGVEAARTGIVTWAAGATPILSLWALAVPVFTVALKGVMFVSVRSLARRASSSALAAAAQDNLSDVITSAMALVGVGLSRLGAPVADPIAALLVSAWIFRAAWGVLCISWEQLTGGAASPELSAAIIQAVLTVPGVLDADRVIVDHVGPEVRADIHIKMAGSTSVLESHHVSHLVRAAVEALPGVDHAFIHVEPIERAGRGTNRRDTEDTEKRES
jgi:cation diffusion facilitator family transporter